MSEINDFSSKINQIQEDEMKLSIQKELMIKKALESEDVNQIFKARQYQASAQDKSSARGISRKDDVPIKTILVDPNDLSSGLAYKNKQNTISYDILRAMSRTHIIKAIIDTRKTQISTFCQPQNDKYSPGFIIQPKRKFSQLGQKIELNNSQKKKIDDIIEFIVQCGSVDNYWHSDSFDTFVSKVMGDSLMFDQGCFEVGRNNQGIPTEFTAVDASTMRISDSYDDDQYTHNEIKIKGYSPSYVQILDGQVRNEYYPWQLCFGVRNPSTDITTNGYGRAELEDMILTVTSLLNSDAYNSNFFKVGASPKGILKYSGEINNNTLEQFRSQWTAQTAGVMNAHKVPLINADKIDWIDLQKNNRDMEFSKFQEFLIKISCAIYKIDPSEIGFPMAGSSQQPGFGGSVGNAEKLKYSKDKGLTPLLRQIERWLNKYIVSQIDKNFEFKFVGLEDEVSFKEDLDNNVTMLANFMTLNEIRAIYNLEPVPYGDIVLNSVAAQSYMQQQQQEQMQQQQDQQDQYQQNHPFQDNDGEEEDQNNDEQNPFLKGLNEQLEQLLSQPIN